MLYAKTMIKKLILLGFALVLLVGLPLTLFVLQNQTKPQSSAAASTQFSFSLPSGSLAVGQSFNADVIVDPGGQNQVSFVKVTFTYDGNKIDKASNSPVTIDTSKYTILEQPAVNCDSSNLCQVSFTISVGNTTSNIIKTATDVAKVALIAKVVTDPGTTTDLKFVTGQNQALSVATSDQPAENVFQSGKDGSLTIQNQTNSGGGTTDSTTPTPDTTTGSSGSGSSTTTDTGTGSGGSGGTGSTAADTTTTSCSDFTADVNAGSAPLTVTFSATGTTPTDTIAKVTFNYGDGLVDDVATGSGIGTNTATTQISHTYQSNGTYTASAVFTTAGGNASSSTDCTQKITVGSTVNANSQSTKGGLPNTGPGETLLFVGAAGAILTILGGAIVLGL